MVLVWPMLDLSDETTGRGQIVSKTPCSPTDGGMDIGSLRIYVTRHSCSGAWHDCGVCGY